MDKRLRLTKEQLKAVQNYNRAVKELLDAKVISVFREYETILAINGEQVDDIFFEEDADVSSGDVLVDVEEPEVIACPHGLCLNWNCDNKFGVRFKR